MAHFATTSQATAERLIKALRPEFPTGAKLTVLRKEFDELKIRIEWDAGAVTLLVPHALIEDYESAHPSEHKRVEEKLRAFIKDQFESFAPNASRVAVWAYGEEVEVGSGS